MGVRIRAGCLLSVYGEVYHLGMGRLSGRGWFTRYQPVGLLVFPNLS